MYVQAHFLEPVILLPFIVCLLPSICNHFTSITLSASSQISLFLPFFCFHSPFFLSSCFSCSFSPPLLLYLSFNVISLISPCSYLPSFPSFPPSFIIFSSFPFPYYPLPSLLFLPPSQSSPILPLITLPPPLPFSQCADPYAAVVESASETLECSVDTDGDGIPDVEVQVLRAAWCMFSIYWDAMCLKKHLLLYFQIVCCLTFQIDVKVCMNSVKLWDRSAALVL